MARAGLDGISDGIAGLGAVIGRIEETKMAVPGNFDEDLEILRGREIEKPFGGDVVNADYICAEFANLGEVRRRLFGRRKELAGSIGRERAVRNAVDGKFLFAEPKKFAIHGYP